VSSFESGLKIFLAFIVGIFGLKFWFGYQQGQKAKVILKSKELDDDIEKTKQEIDAADLRDVLNKSNERHRAKRGVSGRGDS
jgi:cell division protein FtsB